MNSLRQVGGIAYSLSMEIDNFLSWIKKLNKDLSIFTQI